MLSTVIYNILSLVVLFLGPAWASFCAAQIMRSTKITKSEGGRSECDHCGHKLSAIDLIPVLSYPLQRGKCRYCKHKIPVEIWLSELFGLVISAVLAIGLFRFSVYTTDVWEWLIYFIFGVLVCGIFIYLGIYDLFLYEIPTNVTQVLVGVVIGGNIIVILLRFLQFHNLRNIFLGGVDNLVMGVALASLFWFLILLTKQKGMGVGDVIIGLLIGLGLGWPGTITAFYTMIFSASLVGLLFAWKRKKLKGLIVPLVPFLAFGFVVGYVYGVTVFNFLFVHI